MDAEEKKPATNTAIEAKETLPDTNPHPEAPDRDEDVPQNMLPSRLAQNASAAAAACATTAAASTATTNATYNWQSGKLTVKERLEFLFNNEILADVHFVVGRSTSGPEQRIPAHKFVLSIGSAVFDAMFNGELSTGAEEIELPDIEPAAFLTLLRFLYSDERRTDEATTIGPETVMTTLYTAKKYAVPGLEKHCVDFLKTNLCSDNAFILLTQARLFDEPQLAALCLDTIDKNTQDSLNADGFVEIDGATLCAVLERDTLRVREIRLFEAAVRWAEAECHRRGIPPLTSNKRVVLEPCVSCIRFPLMSIEEFAVGPAQSGLLSDRQVVSLFLYFTLNPKPAATEFLDVPRCCMTGKELCVSRFMQVESRWGYSGTSDRVRFLVDHRIFVAGFGLYGSIHGPADYSAHIQIIHTSSGNVAGSHKTKFSCDGSSFPNRVMFKEPVEIMPHTSYIATVMMKGCDSFYGTKGLRKVTVETHGGVKISFQFSYAAGNNNGTSVEDGQIPEIIFYT